MQEEPVRTQKTESRAVTTILNVLRILTGIAGIPLCLMAATGLENVFLPGLETLLMLLLILAVPVNFVFGLVLMGYGRSFRPVLLNLLLIVLLVPSLMIGGKLREMRFINNLPRYGEAVEMMQDGRIELRAVYGGLHLPEGYSDLAYMVHAGDFEGTGFTAVFLTGGGFPVKHTGYLYRADDDPYRSKELIRLWPIVKKMAPGWYRVAD